MSVTVNTAVSAQAEMPGACSRTRVVGIINSGLGNVGSVASAFEFYRHPVRLMSDPRELAEADVLVLAGVGNFAAAIKRLEDMGMVDALKTQVLEHHKPLMGICLGMQLMADRSLEDGEHAGLGFISGDVVKIEGDNLRVPHIGWNQAVPRETALFQGIRYGSFYFMHSYHFIPRNPDDILAITQYGPLQVVSAVRRGNILGVQFHPEKSQGDGLRIIRNFMESLS